MDSEASFRPTISFPLGLVLLVVLLVSIFGFLSCCYKMKDIRILLFQASLPQDTGHGQPSDDSLSHSITVIDLKKPDHQLHDQSLAVVMPGEEAPKYLAFPAPLIASAN